MQKSTSEPWFLARHSVVNNRTDVFKLTENHVRWEGVTACIETRVARAWKWTGGASAIASSASLATLMLREAMYASA